MGEITVKTIKIPPGEVILGEYEDKLCLLDWKYRKMRESVDRRICSGLKASFREGYCQLFEETEKQLDEYFSGKRKIFNLPLLTVGTPFQREVWENLLKIPYGKRETYGGLACMMGKEKAIRAVAGANGANALSIVIPCHRIIGSNGSLGGYAGGLGAKRKLLDLESQEFLGF